MKTTQLFTKESEIKKAVGNFKTLLRHPGWITLVKILDHNIEVVRDQILTKPAGATEEDMDRFRANLEIMKSVRDTPENMIEQLSPKKDDEGDQMVDIDKIYD